MIWIGFSFSPVEQFGKRKRTPPYLLESFSDGEHVTEKNEFTCISHGSCTESYEVKGYSNIFSESNLAKTQLLIAIKLMNSVPNSRIQNCSETINFVKIMVLSS